MTVITHLSNEYLLNVNLVPHDIREKPLTLTEDKMGKKHRKKSKRKLIAKMLSVPLFLIFSYVAVRIGISAGNFIFSIDTGFIKSLDTENFKITLNKSIPLIETVYNSGKVNISIATEIENLVEYIFGFDLNTPMTILNSNSPIFTSFYNKEYQKWIAQNDAEREHEPDIPG